MKRRPASDYRDLHAAADSFEPRFARAYLKAVERIRASASIYELAHALNARDEKRALRALEAGITAAMAPLEAILRDARARGKRLGVAQVKARA